MKNSDFNVTYNSPGKSDRSMMPLGNGETCISLWVEEDGALNFYISRSDALTELDRTVKLGQVAVSIDPNPFTKGKSFKQELVLEKGLCKIETEEAKITCFVSKMSETIYISGEFQSPCQVSLDYINWRTGYSVSEVHNGNMQESPDVILKNNNNIVFYHKNEETIIPFLLKLQDLEQYKDAVTDTLTGRIFGGIMSLGGGKANGNAIKTENKVKNFSAKISTNSGIYENEDEFISKITSYHSKVPLENVAMENTSLWWKNYFEKSYIYVEGDKPKKPAVLPELIGISSEPLEFEIKSKSNVSTAYMLTKYMFACCSFGEFPVLYNGMLFNLMPGGGEHYNVRTLGRALTLQPCGKPDLNINPDERTWCRENLWQNLRHPYTSMALRGESENLKVLFKYFSRFKEINRAMAKVYHGAQGQYNTEMTLSFGIKSGNLYGLDRRDMLPGQTINTMGGRVDISPGLELIMLMFEYYEYTSDKRFLKEELLPYCKDLFLYIETRFKERKNGKIVIGPVHAVETYHNTIDPITIVAGIKVALKKIFSLPAELVSELEYFKNYAEITPEICTFEENQRKIIAPARIYENDRKNCEPPQLYTIVPYKLYGSHKKEYELILDTYFYGKNVYNLGNRFQIGQTPSAPSYSGWQYMPVCAARLGLADEAADMLTDNCIQKNPGTRFPAMWGPFYDAVPDTDHAANILSTLQDMVMQTDEDKIYLLPAFPKDWNVKFKLYAPLDTTVEVTYENGEISELLVSPPERKKDVVLP